METLSVEEALESLRKLISYANKDHTHFRITSDEGTIVVLSEESYQNLVVTLEVLATPGLLTGIQSLNEEFEEEYPL